MDNIKHFETLWEEAEKLSSQVYKTTSNSLDQIEYLIRDLKLVNNNSSLQEEIKKSITKRIFEEMLFILTSISSFENIDVYKALATQIFINSN